MILQFEHSQNGVKTSSNPLARWAGWAAFGVSALLIVAALVVATAAAALIGAIGAVAMIGLRLGGKTRSAGDPNVLEARRTPEGWIAEAAPRPR